MPGPDGVTVTDAGLWLLRDHPVVDVFSDGQPAGDPASLLAACLGANPSDRPSAARAAEVTGQIAAAPAGGPGQWPGPRLGCSAPRGHGRRDDRPPGPTAASRQRACRLRARGGAAIDEGQHAATRERVSQRGRVLVGASGACSRVTARCDRPTLGTVVRGGSHGQIRPDVATDMLNLIGPVRASLIAGRPTAVAGLVATLRTKLATRFAEGAITTAAASTIRAELDRHVTQSEWTGGFTAGITINNTGSSAINGWTLTFTFGG